MTFFFEKGPVIRAKWVTRNISSNEGSSQALLGRTLWRKLGFLTSDVHGYISAATTGPSGANHEESIMLQVLEDEEVYC